MARPGLTKNRKFLRLARALGSEALAIGHLELIWEQCYENGEDYLGDAADVEAVARWKGGPGALVKALITAGGEGRYGFIEEIEDRPGHYRCHDLFDHAPNYVAKRLERELQRRQNGTTISEIRAAAGRKGAEVTNSKRPRVEQQLTDQQSANGRQFAATPAPAPIENQNLLSKPNGGLDDFPHQVDHEHLESSSPKTSRTKRSHSSPDPDAVRIYEAYPRHVARAKAIEAIKKALAWVQVEKQCSRDFAVDFIYQAVVKFVASPAGQRGEYTPHCSTWMTGHRFLDDPAEWHREHEPQKNRPDAAVTASGSSLSEWLRELKEDPQYAGND